MIDKFSWSRVGLLIRRYFSENSRQLLMTLGVVFGIMLFFGLTINKSAGDYSKFDGTGAILWMILFCIISFALIIVGSLTFSSMSTKPKRIVAMMVPASKSEKFVSLLIIYNVMAPIAIILSALLVDVLTSLVFMHEPYFIHFLGTLGDFFSSIKREDYGFEVMLGIIAFVGGSLLCSLATYTLGSALWPKKSFIKTFCVLFAFQMIIPMIIPGNLSLRLIEWIRDFDFENINLHILAWSVIAVYYAFAGFIYWLAWRRYRSTQVIQKFMMD